MLYRILLFCSFVAFPIITNAQQIIVNEYFNTSAKEDEWVELVTTGTVDIRGYHLKDFTGTGNPSGDLVFTSNSLWESVPSGTFIVLMGANVAQSEDFDSGDGIIKIKVTNTTYLTGSQFNIGGTSDAVQITNSSDTHVHGVSHGSSNLNSLPAPKAHYSGSSSSNTSIGFLNTSVKEDFANSLKVGVINSPSIGAGNDTENTSLISSFKEPEEAPTLKLTMGSSAVQTGAEIDFGTIFANDSKDITFSFSNLGQQSLEINNLSLSGTDFFITTALSSTQIETYEIFEMVVSFMPRAATNSTATLSFNTNDQTQSTVSITLKGEALDEADIISIADARTLQLGSIVTVGGRITVANEFSGPAYLQDGTAGISVYFTDLHYTTQRGDSVQVTGPLAEFGTTASGKGLVQISGSNISFNVINAERVEPTPQVVTIGSLTEIHQSQLIEIKNAQFETSGNFQGNTNYTISDGTGSVELRIDGDTDLVGAVIPNEAVDIIAVVSRYGGTIQILPRDVKDLNVEEVVIPGSDIPLDQTFDIVTWNMLWFGYASDGPTDDALQIANAAEVIQTMDADVYALEEISNVTAFNTLLSQLTGYRGFIAPISQTQKTGFIFKPSVVDSLTSGFISTDWSDQSSWATGRYPYEFIANVNINGESKLIYMNVIHAKALSDLESYTRRVNDVQELKTKLDLIRSDVNYIMLGDYNDFITNSTYSNNVDSPYKIFVDDPNNWKVVTKSLEDKGFTSYKSSSMIDHITISNELYSVHIDGAEQIENPTYIGNYISSTSDHYPVKTRFIWGTPTSNENMGSKPNNFDLEQNYPNPFNPTTTIAFNLDKAQQVNLTVYTILGAKVSELVSGQNYGAGRHEVRFDASRLASGTYVYQLRTGDGKIMTRMMSLVK
ncbi:T9SS type A sorting domain-containing protein [bacterium]|nr:MAG: T9SS type A sorting domain-containing protein [bacterium]